MTSSSPETGRQRLRRILSGKSNGHPTWTTLVDGNTLDAFPGALKGIDPLSFYRRLECDIFLLNNWGLDIPIRSPRLDWGAAVRITTETEGSRVTVMWETPHGALTGVYERSHPLKYPVDSLEAIRIFHRMWEGAAYREEDDHAEVERLNAAIGDDGVFTRFWGPSAIPRLLEENMGTENFYYLMADHPEEMDGLIRTMHEQDLRAYDILARGPWESVTLTENTSTYYISPDLYRDYNMPHQRDAVERFQKGGKTAILHMCGHVRTLLPLIKETGCDGIHALTPPPTGDCPWEDALDVLGDDCVIIGALDPTIFAAGPVEGIGPALDRLITPRVRESPFVLCPFADGIAVPFERFQAVQDWFSKQKA